MVRTASSAVVTPSSTSRRQFSGKDTKSPEERISLISCRLRPAVIASRMRRSKSIVSNTPILPR